ncbi:hypothetical protein OG194_36355 [Streptomyces sp. NBC_01288]|uniref:hypothetical protein n=1 Tax=Streptomyces sp. NBC_01288 TaxID=2903814 RepID=UPI002E0E208C|nr:hypothetical protein OG194_36355 [Streptomyces sp. NBC_01288]
MKRVLRKAEILLLTAILKVDRSLGMGKRHGPPARIAVRVASRPLRSAAVLAVPLAALGGMTFGAFTDWTRFLQAVLVGAGMTLFFALFLRLERLAQLHYERVGYDPVAPPPVAPLPAHRPRPGGLGRGLAILCASWGVMSVVFWSLERAKGTPVSWLFTGVFIGLVLLGSVGAHYLVERKRQRARPPTS